MQPGEQIADGIVMHYEPWVAFMAALLEEKKGPFFASRQDFERFGKFVELVPKCERIPLLLHAYDRYRELSVGNGGAFDLSCWSILISTTLCSGIEPNGDEAVQILRRSYHRCGHGNDVDPPVSLAEKAFAGKPYTRELFDAAAVYRQTLRVSRSSKAANVKQKLSWILWHDPARIEKRCVTRRIQLAIHSMEPDLAFRWQWFLRNTQTSMHAGASKSWCAEAGKRVQGIGEEEYLRRMDDWLTMQEGEVELSPAGSSVLRLLVWYGYVVSPERSLPILVRLARAKWQKKAPVGKVMGALAWLIRTGGDGKFRDEVEILCRHWGDESAEVKRLELQYFPLAAEKRERAQTLRAGELNEEMEELRGKAFEMLGNLLPQRLPGGGVEG